MNILHKPEYYKVFFHFLVRFYLHILYSHKMLKKHRSINIFEIQNKEAMPGLLYTFLGRGQFPYLSYQLLLLFDQLGILMNYILNFFPLFPGSTDRCSPCFIKFIHFAHVTQPIFLAHRSRLKATQETIP